MRWGITTLYLTPVSPSSDFFTLEDRDSYLYDYRTCYTALITGQAQCTKTVYSPEPTSFEGRLMTKYAHAQAEDLRRA